MNKINNYFQSYLSQNCYLKKLSLLGVFCILQRTNPAKLRIGSASATQKTYKKCVLIVGGENYFM